MRITSGFLGGRRIPDGVKGFRPTQDRVREALFSSLGPRLQDAQFLDLYAGSGAVGLEAWSRGAERVTWVEQHDRTHKQLIQTIQGLCGENEPALTVLRGDAVACLQKGLSGSCWDVVFADPPYADSENLGLADVLAESLLSGGLLAEGGIFVFEHAKSQKVTCPEGWSIVNHKTYGDTCLEYLVPA